VIEAIFKMGDSLESLITDSSEGLSSSCLCVDVCYLLDDLPKIRNRFCCKKAW